MSSAKLPVSGSQSSSSVRGCLDRLCHRFLWKEVSVVINDVSQGKSVSQIAQDSLQTCCDAVESSIPAPGTAQLARTPSDQSDNAICPLK